MSWYKKSPEEVLTDLHLKSDKGITEQEAQKRLEQYGPNRLATNRKKTWVERIFAQLNNVLIYVLIIAAVVSAFVGEIADAIIIGLVVIINAVVGVIQESKAEDALEALKNMATPKAIVQRDGEMKEIDSAEVVPGDFIVVSAGSYIPCDIRLIESANLKVEEAALTGESVPVDKDAFALLEKDNQDIPLGDQKNMLFMSTLVTVGRGTGIAVATGMDTQIGKIAGMLNMTVDEQTPLQKSLAQVGKYLGIAALVISLVMFLIGVLQGRDFLEMFMIAISLAVAAIPEGMPAIVSIVLAIGVQRMIKQHVIIRKLPAVEALGSVNVICSDKTGTLTQNKMTVTKFYADGQIQDITDFQLENDIHNRMMKIFVLCNDATYTKDAQTGDPTEIALVAAGAHNRLNKSELEKEYQRLQEIPFDSDRKLMTTVHIHKNVYYRMTKGAIDRLLNRCNRIMTKEGIIPLTEKIQTEIMDASHTMSQSALRVLAAAYQVEGHEGVEGAEEDLIFVGFVGMMDPPRLEVKESIEVCKTAGIRTVMITGDHRDTAFAIAHELGIAAQESEVMEGIELDSLTDEDIKNACNVTNVFARVSPEHKVKIVQALKAVGHTVSMTGDGVNDAPSLKEADIGVAMGITGTDVAKGASDMVLTDDNFASIVKAVEEGRNIYKNIKKSVIFLISCNLGEIIALFFAIAAGWPTPLRSIHILWVNLVTDTFPALALGVDPEEPGVMKEKPRGKKEGLFHGMLPFLLLNGLLIGVITLAAFVIGLNGETSDVPENVLMHAQTMAFITLSFSQLIHSFNFRSMNQSVFKVGIFKNKFLLASTLVGIIIQVLIVSIGPIAKMFSVQSLGSTDWIIVAGLSLLPLIINELVKLFKGSGGK
ncbi:cation-translocating P-type ATPase [Psychrobacillus antarcticus]|uniref:cation-translocating P-type ATPase n=1 Tax=Psychrobacillus antarcticus TaxID=2879115 RepID=UPI0024078D91|nr:cation-translocating P-type ATPase [Psychrobacillus antarcticus]